MTENKKNSLFEKIETLVSQAKEISNDDNQLKIKLEEISSTISGFIKEIKSSSQIPDLSPFRILLVEDNQINIIVAETFLKKTGCKILTANNGKEALKLFTDSNDKKIDLILMDMQMPEMDGVESVTEIRKLGTEYSKSVKVIFMTGNSIETELEKTKDLEIGDWIQKPVISNTLYEKCATLLGVKSLIEKENKTQKTPKENKKINIQQSYPDFSNKKALVVDDNKLNVEIINLMVKKTNCDFENAFDGEEAFEKFMNSPENYFDIILMDIQMPKMDGNECARKIRNSQRKDNNIPIIAISANAFKEDKEESLEAGINIHLSKPVNMKELHSQMETLLNVHSFN